MYLQPQFFALKKISADNLQWHIIHGLYAGLYDDYSLFSNVSNFTFEKKMAEVCVFDPKVEIFSKS